jgi:hypothetical protein
MSSFSLKSDKYVRDIANTKVAQIKTYAIDCNHEIIARDQEIVGLRGGIVFFYIILHFLNRRIICGYLYYSSPSS